MDFHFTEEQQQFAEAIRRWTSRDYTFDFRRTVIHSAEGISSSAWRTLSELGLTALPVPEEYGGFNGSAIDLFVVMQELGRSLVVEPYFANAWGTWFLAQGSGKHLAAIASGNLKVACAFGEAHARHDMNDITTVAHADADGFVITGNKAVAVHAAQADILIVSALLDQQIALFAVPADAAGLLRTDYRTIDGMRAANVQLAGVRVPADSLVAKGWDLMEQGLDFGVTLLCAEAMGALQALMDATLEYTKTRTQFGVPIGKFQALQHRMADMYIHLEQARSMALLAAVKVASTDAVERRRCVSAAKYRIGQAIRFVGQQAVQLHGGMGVTDELPAAHHFKRLTMIELTLGDSDHHLQRFIDCGKADHATQ